MGTRIFFKMGEKTVLFVCWWKQSNSEGKIKDAEEGMQNCPNFLTLTHYDNSPLINAFQYLSES